MSWVKTDFWLSPPMKGFRVNPDLLFRDRDVFVDFYGNPKEYATLITLLFEEAGVIPAQSVLIGVHQDWGHIDVILIFVNKAFPRIEEGGKYPVEERASIDQTKWDAAMAALRVRVKELHGQVAALEVR